jgi:hypothetical protein
MTGFGRDGESCWEDEEGNRVPGQMKRLSGGKQDSSRMSRATILQNREMFMDQEKIIVASR